MLRVEGLAIAIVTSSFAPFGPVDRNVINIFLVNYTIVINRDNVNYTASVTNVFPVNDKYVTNVSPVNYAIVINRENVNYTELSSQKGPHKWCEHAVQGYLHPHCIARSCS